MLDAGFLCGGAGSWYPDRGNFPRGGIAVFSGVLVDCMWLRLLSALGRSAEMNIVVWKSPKALRGILRRLFKIHE